MAQDRAKGHEYDGREVGQASRAEIASWFEPRSAGVVRLAPVEVTASSGSQASQASLLGAPPEDPQALVARAGWAPRRDDAGVEWLRARFVEGAHVATALLIVEAEGPGAVFAVFDESRGKRELIWQRAPVDAGPQARVLRVYVPDARVVTQVRIWLDARAVAGRNQLNAVALEATAAEGLSSEVQDALAKMSRRARRAAALPNERAAVITIALSVGVLLAGAVLAQDCRSRAPGRAARAPAPHAQQART